MKQNRSSKPATPYKGRARPNRIAFGIAIALALAVALLCVTDSSANEPGKKDEPKLKTAASSLKPIERVGDLEYVSPQTAPVLSASAATDKGRQLKWQNVSSGAIQGGTSVTFELGRAPGYVLDETIGQLAVGWGSSDSYDMNSGYWQEFEECPGRGDPTNDGAIDVADVMFLINYLFTGTSAPDPMCNGDANCDGAVDVADVMYLINYLFTGTSPPGC